MNPKAMPPLTVTPSAHQVPLPAPRVRYQGNMPWREGFCTLARAAVTTGRWHGPLAAAGVPVAESAGGGRPSLAFGRGWRPGGM